MKTTYLNILFITLSSTMCENLVSDKEYPLYLINNAPHSVGYYLALGDGYATTVYPDTTLPLKNIFSDVIIKPGQKAIIYNGHLSWDKAFKVFLPKDTLSAFIFHADTLNKFTWEEIRVGYRILKRYDLSLDDLKRMDFTITYP